MRTDGLIRYALIALLGAAGCDSGALVESDWAFVHVTTGESSYSPGDSVIVTLRNVGRVNVSFKPCPSWLDRASGESWTVATIADWYAADACEPVSTSLLPGDSTEFQLRLNPGLVPGTYRLRFDGLQSSVEISVAGRVSNSFAVR